MSNVVIAVKHQCPRARIVVYISTGLAVVKKRNGVHARGEGDRRIEGLQVPHGCSDPTPLLGVFSLSLSAFICAPAESKAPISKDFLPVADSPRPISSIRLPIPSPLHGPLFVWRQLGAQPTGEPWWSWSWPTETASKGRNSSPPLLSQQSKFGRQPRILWETFVPN